jgi:hypothetical protein
MQIPLFFTVMDGVRQEFGYSVLIDLYSKKHLSLLTFASGK